MLQLYLNENNPQNAIDHAEQGLNLFYKWGAISWDQRASYKQWITFSHLLLFKAKRKIVSNRPEPAGKRLVNKHFDLNDLCFTDS